MRRFIKQVFLIIFTFLLAISCSDKKDSKVDNENQVYNEKFTEGVIEFGMYALGIDLDHLIDNIDFSKDNVKQQWEEIIKNLPPENNFIDLINEMNQRNPMLALGIVMNSVVPTYYIKDNQVLGVHKGFGYDYDNYHDLDQNFGKLYLKTYVNHPEITEENKELSVKYSLDDKNQNMDLAGDLSIDMFNRKVSGKRKNILGYEADLTIYTLKDEFKISTDWQSFSNPLGSLQVYQINVYTSPKFSKTINFSHPYYLPEEDGIIELEVFFEENTEVPTMIMKPKKIDARAIAKNELQIRTSEPIYDDSDISWTFKAMGIMMSGWSVLGE